MADKFDYTHGAQGSKPTSALDFQTGDAIPPENFDWYWYTVIQAINDHASLLEAIDSDENGTVDAAEAAAAATNATNVTGTYKGNDIDSDGDGVVDESDQTQSLEVRTNDPSAVEGRVWIRSDL